MENIRNIIESLLFVSDSPLTVDKLKSVLETVDAKEIRTNLNALADQYEARGGGFRLCEVAGGWQLRTRSKYHEYIKRMLQPAPQRLSRAALETLAIVAYNQPIIRSDIEHIRGVDCGGMLRQLLERKLIRVLGRKEIPGRPLIYATSKLFLELFELKNLKDLPTPKEIEEMGTLATDETGNPATNFISDTPSPPPSGTTGMATASASTFASPDQNVAPQPDSMAKPASHGPERIDTLSKTVGRPAATASGQTPISAVPHKIPLAPSGLSSNLSDMPVQSTGISKQALPISNRPVAEKSKDKSATTPNAGKPKKP